MQTAISKESQIISLLTKGNEEAFEELYHSYSKRLLGYLIKLVKSESIAAELLQDTFLKIWNNRERIDPERSFRSYLFRIAENLVFDFFRNAAQDKKMQATLIKYACEEYSHVEEGFCAKENEQILHDVINLLPPRRQQIFQLIKIEGYSYDEVSCLLSISNSTISDHIVKATKFIREELADSSVIALSLLLILIS